VNNTAWLISRSRRTQ